MSKRIAEALTVACEVNGATLSDTATDFMVRELAAFGERAALLAITRCCRELMGRLTLADIIERIDDGRPGPEEAWSRIGTGDERATIVTTEEAWQAFAVVNNRAHPAEPSLLQENPVAARMAFLETYKRLVATARANRESVRWRVSLGQDQAQRLPPLREAVARGQIKPADVAGMLPAHEVATLALPEAEARKILQSGERRAATVVKRLPDVAQAKRDGRDDAEIARRLAELADTIKPVRKPSPSVDWQAAEERLNRRDDL